MKKLAILFGCLTTMTTISPLLASDQFDPTASWPLCGHITQAPPINWQPLNGCPDERWGNPDFTDFPLSSTFGPRQKASQSFRYDYHRGVDIPAAFNTPIFAISGGKVRIAGNHSSYSDPLVQIRHYRPGYSSCKTGQGCYASNYIHLSSWVVSSGETVSKGQLIGYTGSSDSGFEHLHFEIRNAPGSHDAYSSWQRDTIHPLQVLPYHNTQADNISVTIDQVNLDDPLTPQVTVTATMINSIQLDLDRLAVTLFEKQPNGQLIKITQPGENGVGITPEGTGYQLHPPWLDITTFNRQYSYKNSSQYPWSRFKENGTYQSPFWSELPTYYNANVHLDKASQNDNKIGEFNGLLIAPAAFNTRSTHYQLTLTFNELIGTADPANLCVQAVAIDVHGDESHLVAYNCQ